MNAPLRSHKSESSHDWYRINECFYETRYETPYHYLSIELLTPHDATLASVRSSLSACSSSGLGILSAKTFWPHTNFKPLRPTSVTQSCVNALKRTERPAAAWVAQVQVRLGANISVEIFWIANVVRVSVAVVN